MYKPLKLDLLWVTRLLINAVYAFVKAIISCFLKNVDLCLTAKFLMKKYIIRDYIYYINIFESNLCVT